MPQLWQGRASKAVDSRVNDFNSSIRFDARMIEQDIQGSLVHSAMLGRQGIISRQDVDDIHKGLHSILDDLHSGALEIDPNAEDVHTFVEQTLTARVGDAGKRLHTGRSRNYHLLELAMRAFYQVRDLPTVAKKPSTSELLDWLQALRLGGVDPEKIEAELPYAGILLKKNEDLTAVKNAKNRVKNGFRW